MIQHTILLLLALLWHIKSSPLHDGLDSVRAGRIAWSIVEQRDPAPAEKRLSSAASVTCPALQPFLDDHSLSTHNKRGSLAGTRAESRIARPGQTTTPFGTIIRTLPLEDSSFPNKYINLRLDRGRPASEDYVELRFLDDQSPSTLKHIVPRWTSLDNTQAYHTIQEIHAEFDDYNSQLPYSLQNLMYHQAERLVISAEEVISKEYAAGATFLPRDRSSMLELGGYQLLIAVFDNIAGFAYTIRRKERQPAVQVDEDASISSDHKAVGLAIIMIVRFVTLYLMWQLSLQNTSNTAPISTREAMYVGIATEVLTDLLDRGLDSIAHADNNAPPPDLATLNAAIEYLGSGTAPSSREEGQPFMDYLAFSDELRNLDLCQQHGGSGMIDTA